MQIEREGKLLVAVDGSERSLNTARYLAQVPAFHKMKIRLFTVLSGVPEFYWDLAKEPSPLKPGEGIVAWAHQERERRKAHVEKCREILLEGGYATEQIESELHDRKKGVARDIISEARSGYDAVVLRRRGMTQIVGLVMGSVAQKLIGGLDFVPVILAGLTPQTNRFLIAYDGSESADKAVDFVCQMLGGSGARVQLTHVLRSEPHLEASPDFAGLAEAFMSDAENEMTALMEKARHRLETAGFDPASVMTKVIRGALSRAAAITDEAETGNFSTIVVGRRGLSKVQEFSMGRVGNKIIHLARMHSVWVVT
ncbi:MAG: universal stress protein [Desulfobacterales bacterium]